MQPDSTKAAVTTVPVSAVYAGPMRNQTAIIPDMEADIRWRDWQARGAASDRRTAARMRNVVLFIIAAMVVWFVVRLA